MHHNAEFSVFVLVVKGVPHVSSGLWQAPDCLPAVCSYHKVCTRAERGLPPNKLVPKLREQVDTMRALLPVVQVGREHDALDDLTSFHCKDLLVMTQCIPDYALGQEGCANADIQNVRTSNRTPTTAFFVLCHHPKALRNRAFKERHWSKVFEAVETVFDRAAGFTLQVYSPISQTAGDMQLEALWLLVRRCLCHSQLAQILLLKAL
jgi:hypothetical protein